jgi:hypothetical protein
MKTEMKVVNTTSILKCLILSVLALGALNACSGPSISRGYETIDFGSRQLINDRWGVSTGETAGSGIFYNNAGDFGWYWNRADPKPQTRTGRVQPIYPDVRIGENPPYKSNSAYFPIAMGSLKSLQLSTAFSYQTKPTGTFDLAFDMFLSDVNQAQTMGQIKAEVKIWLMATAHQPPESYRGEFSDGYNNYQLYSWTRKDGRLYSAFVLTGEPQFQMQITVDAKKLIDNLGINSNWYLYGVALGNEIWEGEGRIQISEFRVNLNGQDL